MESWIGDLIARLKALDVGNWIILFGATLLLAVLPLIILLSSLANQRIDDDISRHIGLDSQGAHIIHGLFRSSPTHPAVPVITGLLFALAGTLAVVSCLQAIYERVFDQEARGWHGLPHFVVWSLVLLAVLLGEGLVEHPLRHGAGTVVQTIASFVGLAVFFAWTMHFLLAGRVPWRNVIRPALVTAFCWIGLAIFSSIYFSSAIVSDSRLYGAIGVVFTLLTWFIAIGAVLVLGAAAGAVWQERSGRRTGRD